MGRGQYLSPPTAPDLRSMMTNYFRSIAFEGSRSGGGKPPGAFMFFEHFTRAYLSKK